MKNPSRRFLSLLLACLLIFGTATVGFAASVGQVKKLSLLSCSSSKVKIQWNSVSKADGYQVESNDGNGWKVETSTSKTAYADKTVKPGTKYTYRVKAYIKSGSKKSFGTPSEKLVVLTYPEAVGKLTVAATTPKAVKLKWAKVKGATSYNIYQSRTEDGKYKMLGTSEKVTYKATYDASPGTLYYKVRAVAKAGSLERMSAPSAAVKVKLVPDAVSSLTAKESGRNYVTLKWPASKGASGYYVFLRDVSTNKKFVQIKKTTATTYKVKFSAAPGTVWFRVQAFAKVGGVVTNAKVSPTLKLSLKPAKVNDLTLKNAGPTKISFAWGAAEGATGYEVYRFNEATQSFQLLSAVNGRTYTASGLKPNTVYRFAVVSVADYKGNILRSGFSPLLTAETILGEITGFDCSLDSNNKLFLSWNPVKGAEGYEVERSYDGKNGWTVIMDVDATVVDVSAKEGGALAKGKTYFYRVRAHAVEDGVEVYTPYADVLEIHPIPDAPTITRTGTAAQHGICVEWTPSLGADGYDVSYFDPAQNKWISRTSDKSPLGENLFKAYTNENGLRMVYYTDRGLSQSGNYQYRVRAVVKNGSGYNYSDPSNVVVHSYVDIPEPAKIYSDATQKAGIVGYLYDPVEDCFCTADDPWQRNFGFNKVYDIASQAVMIQYDTDPIKFTCHEGEQWMIQPWKGQYGMVLYGGEVGVYKKYSDRTAEHYDCANDDDLLGMEMDLYKYNIDTQTWDHAFHRPYGSYWWITGFKFGFLRMVTPLAAQEFKTYKDLYLDVRITMKDFDMYNAFKAALDAQIAKEKPSGFSHFSYTTGTAPSGTVTGNLDLYIKFQ